MPLRDCLVVVVVGRGDPEVIVESGPTSSADLSLKWSVAITGYDTRTWLSHCLIYLGAHLLCIPALFVSKRHGLCIHIEEFCIKNEEFCIKNEEFCI